MAHPFAHMSAIAAFAADVGLDLDELRKGIEDGTVTLKFREPAMIPQPVPEPISLADAVESAGSYAVTDFGNTFETSSYIERLGEHGYRIVPIGAPGASTDA
ncbi:hypothetical protein [Hansschlegelia sp. KR7-227]|uniref:hypothetical protein n=1 Tax=Hansschlegelia sp. KR7-227 TaxID=3400914 RepID=UPI003C0CE3D8